jgi:type II secretory ATPase GspE/PulE/Tfp pilus assembly ATPase PilB-like protein
MMKQITTFKEKIIALFSNKDKGNEELILKKKSFVNEKSAKTVAATRPKHNIIYRSDEIPKHNGILSFENDLSLGGHLSESYAALVSMQDETAVYILCEESKASFRVDNDFLQIRKRCHDQGFKVKRLFTTKNILDITHDKISSVANKDKNKQEEGYYHKLFDKILKRAVDKGSSDIILSIEGGNAQIKMRIKGKVKVDDELPVEKAESLASVAYTSLAETGAKDTTFNERKPQDGIINRIIDGQQVSVRLATIPAHPNGFDMTLRVMPVGSTQSEKPLTTLGYNELHKNLIDYAITIPVGVNIIAGVTGSGKTTTLGTLIRGIIKATNNEKRVITIEDPPEHKIVGATQVPVVRSNKDSEEKSPFNAAMRASLRSDPDILMPGEIRDEESATLMVSATLSGHQVYTTVHAPSMFDILIRLRELGIKNSVLGSSSFISSLMYQSLVRTVCQNCSHSFDDYVNNLEPNDPMNDTIDRIKSSIDNTKIKNIRFQNKNGCSKCDYEGVDGREVIAEVVVPDRAMKTMFMEGRDEDAINYYREAGGKFIVDHGIEKLVDGKVDIRDLEEKVGRIDMSDTPLDEMLDRFKTSRLKASAKEGLVNNEKSSSVETNEFKSSLSAKKKGTAEVFDIKGESNE